MTEPLPADWADWRRTTDLADYDRRWDDLAAAGENLHGEADLVQALLRAAPTPAAVLDAGCGTGRVAVELGRRGVGVVGVDDDPDMLARARAKAPGLRWVGADLAALDLPDRFALVLLAGNVVPYVPADRRAAAVAACARHLAPGGLLLAGFALRPDWPSVADYDAWCAAVGLAPVQRWAGWTREPWTGDGGYVVSLHGRSATAGVSGGSP